MQRDATPREFQAAENYNKQERYVARVGQILLDAPADVLESFMVNRHPGRKSHRRRESQQAKPAQRAAGLPSPSEIPTPHIGEDERNARLAELEAENAQSRAPLAGKSSNSRSRVIS